MSETPASLTTLERTVLWHLASGLRDQEIADAMAYSLAYVKWTVSMLLGRLGLKNRVQLALYALRAGVIRLDEIEIGPGGRRVVNRIEE